MYSKSSIRFSLLFTIFFIFILLNIPSLEASGWGKTEESIEFEGATWNGTYLDMNGLYFTASIPNYLGASLKDNDVFFYGHVALLSAYVIITPFNPDFEPPKTVDEFVEIIQQFEPNYIVTPVDAKGLGAKYAADLIPTKKEDKYFFRVLSTDNRLITLITNDVNKFRRSHFFENIYIH